MGYVYDYNHEIQNAFELAIDPETGEIIDDLAFQRLTDLQMEREEKCEAVALMTKDLAAQIAACGDAIKDIQAKKDALESRMERAKEWLAATLAGDKIKTAAVSVSYRKSSSVSIRNEGLLPEAYFRVKTLREPDKVAIKAAIKNGELVPGAEIVERKLLVIK